MLGALLYLRFTSFKNWVLTRLRGLRQPKQLAGAIAFACYFWFFFLRHWSNGGASVTGRRAVAMQAMNSTGAVLPTNWLPAAAALGAVVLCVLLALMWIVPTQRAVLGFSEAEIAFLFPAPITRPALVHFRLLSGQFRSLIGATIMMLISNRWSFLGGNALTHALGWWFVFSTLNLHFGGATFTLTRLSDAGLGTVWRRLLVLALLVAVFGIALWRLPLDLRMPADGTAVLRPVTDWLINVTNSAPLSWLLLPLKWVLGPFLAPDGRSFLLSLAPALLVIVAHYLWVVRAAVAFEEASIDYAQKRGARIAAWRAGQRRFRGTPSKAQPEPFRLRSTGRAEFAFLWKNLLSTWPYFNLRVLLGAAAAIVVAFSWANARPGLHNLLVGAGGFAGVFALYVLIIGPQFARQDIRSDLANADILKTYPLPGWQIVLGEMLTPVAILTGLLWLALLVVALAFNPAWPRLGELTVNLRIVCALWLALLTPVLVSLQLLVPNAAALVFPTWFQANRARGGGPEVAGQRMIFFFVQLLTMLLALLPGAAVAAALVAVTIKFLGLTPVIAVSLGALMMLAVLIGEVWCGLWWLGERFEKMDLSAELRP
jgi:ABC-2 type transport system permease protein